jgi:hypothetical protein
MRRKTAALILALSAAVALPPTAEAHHSFAMYDQTRTVTLKGAIKTMLWSNPHVVIWLEGAPVTGGVPSLWTIELTSPGNLTRIGWTRTSLKAGDAVELQIMPLRDGQQGGAFKTAKLLATGQVLESNWVLKSQTGALKP